MRMRNVVNIILVIFSCGLIGAAQTQQSSGENARRLVRKVEPRYPDLARKLNLYGTVKVIAVVASDGNVKKVEPMGGSPLLVQAAQSAISQWKFVAGGESREVVELHFNP